MSERVDDRAKEDAVTGKDADADAGKERGVTRLDDAELEDIAGGIVSFPERLFK